MSDSKGNDPWDEIVEAEYDDTDEDDDGPYCWHCGVALPPGAAFCPECHPDAQDYGEEEWRAERGPYNNDQVEDGREDFR